MAPTVQFNIRTAPEVAEAVRARAQERGCALGQALAELVEAGRAWPGDDVVLSLDPPLTRALDALAAAAASTRRQILDDALRGEVRARLLRLANAVAPADEVEPIVRPPARSAPPAPPAEVPTEHDVGLFTVFD